MSDNTFTVKEASVMLDCTTQNIYQQKSKLIQSGYMENSITGEYVLNEKGVNYLREKRTETIKASSKDFNQVDNKGFTNIASPTVATDNTDLINMLKEQLKEEKEYWRNKFEQKDVELQAKNDYIQELNTKAFALLDTGEQNKQEQEQQQIIQQEPVKKSLLQRFFNK